MRIVYAKATTMVAFTNGRSEMVGAGTHWPANDPLVRSHPDLFSDDPRFGLSYTVEPIEQEAEVHVKRSYVRRA
jgi:hypothetical protein